MIRSVAYVLLDAMSLVFLYDGDPLALPVPFNSFEHWDSFVLHQEPSYADTLKGKQTVAGKASDISSEEGSGTAAKKTPSESEMGRGEGEGVMHAKTEEAEAEIEKRRKEEPPTMTAVKAKGGEERTEGREGKAEGTMEGTGETMKEAEEKLREATEAAKGGGEEARQQAGAALEELSKKVSELSKAVSENAGDTFEEVSAAAKKMSEDLGRALGRLSVRQDVPSDVVAGDEGAKREAGLIAAAGDVHEAAKTAQGASQSVIASAAAGLVAVGDLVTDAAVVSAPVTAIIFLCPHRLSLVCTF